MIKTEFKYLINKGFWGFGVLGFWGETTATDITGKRSLEFNTHTIKSHFDNIPEKTLQIIGNILTKETLETKPNKHDTTEQKPANIQKINHPQEVEK